jgi:hypothetical protein
VSAGLLGLPFPSHSLPAPPLHSHSPPHTRRHPLSPLTSRSVLVSVPPAPWCVCVSSCDISGDVRRTVVHLLAACLRDQVPP